MRINVSSDREGFAKRVSTITSEHNMISRPHRSECNVFFYHFSEHLCSVFKTLKIFENLLNSKIFKDFQRFSKISKIFKDFQRFFSSVKKVASSKKKLVRASKSSRDVSGRGKESETVFGEHTFGSRRAFFSS